MSEANLSWDRELRDLRRRLAHGDNATQEELDEIVAAWESRRKQLRPGEKSEAFSLVDSQGVPNGLTAPRWLVHLLALRHRCAHVLVRWEAEGLGRVLVLQVRSWTKPDSPGHVDISVGGHVVGDATPEDTAYGEMEEELGVSRADLVGGELIGKGGYANPPEERPSKNFYNCEWRDVYIADLLPERFGRLNFRDKEVVGIYLCPESQGMNLVDNRAGVPVASGLRYSLPKCLASV